jgi:hypothetical protein
MARLATFCKSITQVDISLKMMIQVDISLKMMIKVHINQVIQADTDTLKLQINASSPQNANQMVKRANRRYKIKQHQFSSVHIKDQLLDYV